MSGNMWPTSMWPLGQWPTSEWPYDIVVDIPDEPSVLSTVYFNTNLFHTGIPISSIDLLNTRLISLNIVFSQGIDTSYVSVLRMNTNLKSVYNVDGDMI